jgi:hypothetical protein
LKDTHNHRLLMDLVARRWTKGKKKPAISNGLFLLPDCAGLCFGGGAGNRTVF